MAEAAAALVLRGEVAPMIKVATTTAHRKTGHALMTPGTEGIPTVLLLLGGAD
jgi:hypothetical protein